MRVLSGRLSRRIVLGAPARVRIRIRQSRIWGKSVDQGFLPGVLSTNLVVERNVRHNLENE